MAEVGAVTMHLSDVKNGEEKKKNSACDSVNTQSSSPPRPPDSLGSRDINVITLLEPAQRQHGWKVVTGGTVDYEHEIITDRR